MKDMAQHQVEGCFPTILGNGGGFNLSTKINYNARYQRFALLQYMKGQVSNFR